MKTIGQRLTNISGQIEGIKKMIDKGDDCTRILVQLKAIRAGGDGVVGEIVEKQFERCAKDLSSKDKNLLISFKKYVQTN